MKVLIPFPLPPNNFVEVRTLNIGDGFLRVAGPSNATQPDFWILMAKHPENNTVDVINLTDLIPITGVAQNMPVVPLPSVVTPIL